MKKSRSAFMRKHFYSVFILMKSPMSYAARIANRACYESKMYTFMCHVSELEKYDYFSYRFL